MGGEGSSRTNVDELVTWVKSRKEVSKACRSNSVCREKFWPDCREEGKSLMIIF